jgi:protoporphyrinogen oxidase
MLWDRMRERIEAAGGRLLLEHRLTGVRHEGGWVRAVEVTGPQGPRVLDTAHLVSTIPLRDLVTLLAPSLGAQVVDAARALRYRDFLVVALILEGPDPFPDTWLYLHDPGIGAGRVQNFRAWSPELVPAPDRSCLGMEYFCTAGDATWSLADGELVEQALRDLAALGFGGHDRFVAGHVVRVREAYPVYDGDWARRVDTIRRGLAAFANLEVAGRNGTHRYNNMDHSMLTGLLAARNVLGERHDLWAVNADEAYLEAS